MIPEIKLKISLEELASKQAEIIAQQSETTYAEALKQVKWLKENSKVSPSSKKSARIRKS